MLNIDSAMANATSDVSLHIGNLVNWFLWGVLTVQLYLYYVAFPHDKTMHKVIVWVIYFLESVHSIGLAAGLSIMMVNMNSNAIIITIILLIIVGALVTMIAQCLYAYRIRAITDMTVIPAGIATLAILQLGAAIAALVVMPVFPIYIWIGSTMINDTVIAVIMVRALANSGALSQQTAWRTSQLIRLIVETGVATAVVNLLSVIFVATMGSIGDVYSAPLIIISKVYANSIMVLLNNRMTIVGSRNAVPRPGKTIDISRTSEYNPYNYSTLQGATLTGSRTVYMQ
ncbi:hypothetical protein AX14_014260 [Amanita brunnescens Koide BX004]|nr:hypothetical protein AX14_014260 [Amanita brunnescens Koide BX004]